MRGLDRDRDRPDLHHVQRALGGHATGARRDLRVPGAWRVDRPGDSRNAHLEVAPQAVGGVAVSIGVPLVLAAVLPILPPSIPAEGAQLAQVLFILTAVLSIPGVDASTRNDATSMVRQVSGRG